MINITNIDLNKSKIDKKSYVYILIYHTGYMTVENLIHITINSVNPLSVIINKTNRYIEESNGNKYLTLVPTDERKGTLKSMKTVKLNQRSY